MAHTKTYIVAENWGKGFIEHSESAKFTISGLPGNVWQVPANNKDANLWIAKVLGTVKTKAEAQAIFRGTGAQSHHGPAQYKKREPANGGLFPGHNQQRQSRHR